MSLAIAHRRFHSIRRNLPDDSHIDSHTGKFVKTSKLEVLTDVASGKSSIERERERAFTGEYLPALRRKGAEPRRSYMNSKLINFSFKAIMKFKTISRY